MAWCNAYSLWTTPKRAHLGRKRNSYYLLPQHDRMFEPPPTPSPCVCVCPGTPQATRTTQKRAKEVYTKHYDSENMAYYWHNKEIGTYLWKKPSGLGGWDVDPEDRVSCGRVSLYSAPQKGHARLSCTHACVLCCCAVLNVRPVVSRVWGARNQPALVPKRLRLLPACTLLLQP